MCLISAIALALGRVVGFHIARRHLWSPDIYPPFGLLQPFRSFIPYGCPEFYLAAASYFCYRMHFHIANTAHTPEVQINLTESILLMRGACFPENANEFFEPIVDFLREYLTELKGGPLTLHLELTYLNSAGKKSLFQLVKLLLDQGCSLRVILYRGTEDDELEDYEGLVQFWRREPRVVIEEREGYYQV